MILATLVFAAFTVLAVVGTYAVVRQAASRRAGLWSALAVLAGFLALAVLLERLFHGLPA